jgi:hypothetical protein
VKTKSEGRAGRRGEAGRADEGARVCGGELGDEAERRARGQRVTSGKCALAMAMIGSGLVVLVWQSDWREARRRKWPEAWELERLEVAC